jgi:hypothetical protein
MLGDGPPTHNSLLSKSFKFLNKTTCHFLVFGTEYIYYRVNTLVVQKLSIIYILVLKVQNWGGESQYLLIRWTLGPNLAK